MCDVRDLANCNLRIETLEERQQYMKKSLMGYLQAEVMGLKNINVLQEIYEHVMKGDNEEIFEQYKPVMKKFTRSQGKMLIKLINRETNQSSYNIVKAFLGSFRAGFWQTFGRFFGVNMKDGYNPENDKKDAVIERVCVRVEQGTI